MIILCLEFIVRVGKKGCWQGYSCFSYNWRMINKKNRMTWQMEELMMNKYQIPNPMEDAGRGNVSMGSMGSFSSEQTGININSDERNTRDTGKRKTSISQIENLICFFSTKKEENIIFIWVELELLIRGRILRTAAL